MDHLFTAVEMEHRKNEDGAHAPTQTETPKRDATVPASAVASPLHANLLPPPLAPSAILISPASRISQLKGASEHWRTINLDGQRSIIDSQALAVVDAEERAGTARKALAEQTKAFKKLEPADLVTRVLPVVRAYQEEIDALTKRAKASEAAYLSLYKLLHDAPDPYVILSASLSELERLQTVEESLRTSQATLASYEHEFLGLKNQEVTVRKLEQENKHLLEEIERRVELAVKEQMSEQQQEIEEVKRACQVQEQLSQARVDSLKEQLSSALAAQAQMQSAALSVDRRAAQASLNSGAEEALLERELERLQHELARSEREVQELKREKGERKHGEAAQREAEVLRLEDEVSALQQQLQTADALLHAETTKVDQLTQASLQAQVALADLTDKHAATVQALRAEIAELPAKAEYEELQRQMRVLQEMEGSHDDNTDHSQPIDLTSTTSPPPGVVRTTPEQLLLAKTRRLESELTRVKLTNTELSGKTGGMQKELTSLREQLQHMRQLNTKLEEDLLHANSHMVQGMVHQQQQQQHTVKINSTLPDDFLREKNVGPVQSPILPSTVTAAASTASAPDSSATAPSTPAATIAQLQAQLQQSTSMLTLVLQQRDRYRSKIDQIEAQSNALAEQLEALKQERATLKQDNLKLYEKLQFVKSMAGSGGGDIESGMIEGNTRGGKPSSSGASSSSPDPESKYAAVYEARINPFAVFKKKQAAAREAQLSTSERLTLAVGRALFSKKLARTFVFGYALLLHILIMVVLWTHSVQDHCGSGLHGKQQAHKH